MCGREKTLERESIVVPDVQDHFPGTLPQFSMTYTNLEMKIGGSHNLSPMFVHQEGYQVMGPFSLSIKELKDRRTRSRKLAKFMAKQKQKASQRKVRSET
jgi:hypothetical protein